MKKNSYNDLTKLTDVFDVSVDYLLGRSDNREKRKKAPPIITDGEPSVGIKRTNNATALQGLFFFRRMERTFALNVLLKGIKQFI